MGVKVNIPVQQILNAHNCNGTQGAKKLASIVAKRADKRVPMQTGTLKNSRKITSAGKGVQLVYSTPYAHYQWEGREMAGRAPKHYTGRGLSYHGGPKRGKEWVTRTWDEDGDAITREFAKAVGGHT